MSEINVDKIYGSETSDTLTTINSLILSNSPVVVEGSQFINAKMNIAPTPDTLLTIQYKDLSTEDTDLIHLKVNIDADSPTNIVSLKEPFSGGVEFPSLKFNELCHTESHLILNTSDTNETVELLIVQSSASDDTIELPPEVSNNFTIGNFTRTEWEVW